MNKSPYAVQVKSLQDRAGELRALAEIMKDEQARTGYLALAEAYEAIARREQAMSALSRTDSP